ncbi:hypothetical protein [Idiomarina xiamenensis]|uniref:Uncharacterized protein n=1 Tax=Idiomarina xiamenensis 10-D-4 TaxID=740709 RepID=K2L4G7_9GAMM|nr:hypothetical protein [Idiomarina xiamenensis]EKE84700.1 hypothetical protein A10D4_03780 [Idiomarina xiamenensis 10-D-4]
MSSQHDNIDNSTSAASMEYAGVLTGDIVDSQKIDASQHQAVLTRLRQTLASFYDTLSLVDFDVYRGDAFQALFAKPADAIKAAMLLRLLMRNAEPTCEVRQSVGIGAIGSLSDAIKRANGEAFTLSGRGLDSLRHGYLSVHAQDAALQQQLGLLTRFVDARLSDLPTMQSRVLLAYLQQPDATHDDLAKHLGKARSTITRSLNSANYQLFEDYLAYVDKCFNQQRQGGARR